MIKKLAPILMISLIPSVSFAKSIYLDCYIKNDHGKKLNFSVTVDKDNKKITHTDSDGSAFNADGFFSKDKISYKQEVDAAPMLITFSYSIDRSSLKIQQRMMIGPDATVDPEVAAKLKPEIKVNTGSCVIAKVKNQQI